MSLSNSRRKHKRVYKRAEWKCEKCGTTEDLTVDHIVPRCYWKALFGNGGGYNNTQILCLACNDGKGADIQSYRLDRAALNSIHKFNKEVEIRIANGDKLKKLKKAGRDAARSNAMQPLFQDSYL